MRASGFSVIAKGLIALCLLVAGESFSAGNGPEVQTESALGSEPGAGANPAPGVAGAIPVLELHQPLTPKASTKDWIQLKSGEWLRGRVKRMRDTSLEFDSDELDDLTIDWKDIVEVRSPLPHTYVFERDKEQLSATGTALVDKQKVLVQVGGEIQEFERKHLVAILRGSSRRDYWSGSFSLGLTLRTGNTEQVDFSSMGWLRRETDRTRVRFDYNGVFGALGGRTSSNNHRALVSIDYFFTWKLYFTPARVEAFTDKLQNIEFRLTPSMGFGYKLMRRGSLEWDVDVGVGYQHTQFNSVPDGDPDSQAGGALVMGTRFESDITKRTDVTINYKLNLALSDVSQTSHHAEFIFSVDIYKAIDLDVSLTWDRIESPPEDAEGRVPDENDLRLVIGIGVDF